MKDLKIQMATDEAQKAQVVEAIKAGITDYIVKPFTGDVLATKISTLFNEKPSQPS